MSAWKNLGITDSLVNAVKGVASGKQMATTGPLNVGDAVIIKEGPLEGRSGKVTGFQSTGRSNIQLHHGRHIAIRNEDIVHLGESYEKKDKKDKKKSKDSKKADSVEINPEIEEAHEARNRQRVIDHIKNVMRGGPVSEGREEGSSDLTKEYRRATPGQSEEAVPDALDYDKYNASNPVVPNEEMQKILDDGGKL